MRNKQSLFYGTIYYQRNGTVEKPVVMLAQDCAGTNPQSMADQKEKLMLTKLTAQSSSSLESRPLQSQCEQLNGIESMQNITAQSKNNLRSEYSQNTNQIRLRYGAYQLFLTPILQLLEMIYFCSFNNQNSMSGPLLG